MDANRTECYCHHDTEVDQRMLGLVSVCDVVSDKEVKSA